VVVIVDDELKAILEVADVVVEPVVVGAYDYLTMKLLLCLH
jgi:hypothetical protein